MARIVAHAKAVNYLALGGALSSGGAGVNSNGVAAAKSKRPDVIRVIAPCLAIFPGFSGYSLDAKSGEVAPELPAKIKAWNDDCL